MTQTERILRHMKDYGSITPDVALREYGVMRLSSRIYDLKKSGVGIVSEDVTGRNRYGEPVRFARYRLLGGNNGKCS